MLCSPKWLTASYINLLFGSPRPNQLRKPQLLKMAEYSKRTVADLTEILKSRGLATTGKKADLIARLTEADKAAETTG